MRLASYLATLLLVLAPCVGQQAPSPPRATSEGVPLVAAGERLTAIDDSEDWMASQPAALGAEPPPEAQPVPEPSTLLLVGTGLVGLAFGARLRRRRVTPSAGA